jgi:gluconokinase
MNRGLPAGPLGVIVMGPAGCGKSTLGAALAAALGAPFLEGDALHPADNIARMAAGIALTDADRAPWLDAVGRAVGAAAGAHRARSGGAGVAPVGGIGVAACSALKRSYRDRLCVAAAVPLAFVCLVGTRELLSARVAARPAHYMPPSLVDSQLALLEVPGPDERGIVLDAALPGAAQLAAAHAWLQTTR